MTLLHMTTPAQWRAGRIDPAPGEDFVHLSRPDQVHVPANLLYEGRTDLITLAIDPNCLAGELRVEDGFPHLYGSITTDAVFDAAPFVPDDDGRFRLVFAPVPPDAEPSATLLAEVEAEFVSLYGGVRLFSYDELWRPGGLFVVGFDEGEPVACAGYRPFPGGGAEIKRMYVRARARSRGIARRLLTAVEEAARRHGHRRTVLDTGSRQPHAEALYRSAGYVEVPPFNDMPAVFWGAKQLT